MFHSIQFIFSNTFQFNMYSVQGREANLCNSHISSHFHIQPNVVRLEANNINLIFTYVGPALKC